GGGRWWFGGMRRGGAGARGAGRRASPARWAAALELAHFWVKRARVVKRGRRFQEAALCRSSGTIRSSTGTRECRSRMSVGGGVYSITNEVLYELECAASPSVSWIPRHQRA